MNLLLMIYDNKIIRDIWHNIVIQISYIALSLTGQQKKSDSQMSVPKYTTNIQFSKELVYSFI